MTRNLWWITLAAALTALAGAAWAEGPHKDTASAAAPKCCAEKGCCTAAAATASCPQCAGKGCCTSQAKAASCCTKEAEGTCCACCGKQSVAAKDGACCAKGCTCCTKEASCCCSKETASAKGCACCAKAAACRCTKAAASRAGKKKQVVVYVVTTPPMPAPLPVPAVCVPHPMAPAGPVTVIETPDGVRHICTGSSCGAAVLPPPPYLCPPPAPVAAEPLPPPAPIVSNLPPAPVEARLTGAAAVPPPPPGPMTAGATQAAEAPCRCRLEAATEDGETHLKVWSGPSTCVTCDHLDLKVAGFSGIRVAIADKQVRLHTPSADAKADRIAVAAQEDQLILEGNVRLQYHLNEAEHADVSASRVVVYLADGRVEIQPSRPETRPASLQAPPATPPVFNFFTGFIR